MAELGPGPHESGDVAQAYGTTVTAAASVRDALIRKGLLYSSRTGETAFTVPAFDEFLRQVGDTKTFSALVVSKRRKR